MSLLAFEIAIKCISMISCSSLDVWLGVFVLCRCKSGVTCGVKHAVLRALQMWCYMRCGVATLSNVVWQVVWCNVCGVASVTNVVV